MKDFRQFACVICFLLLAVGLGVVSLWGINPASQLERLSITSWNTGQGLPDDSINSIVQTGDGYLWIGTNRGLVRFAGDVFETIEIKADRKKLQLQPQRIADLFVDRQDTLWIALPGGLGQSTGIEGSGARQFEVLSFPAGLVKRRISRVYGDSSGSLWLGTADDYLGRLDKEIFTRFDRTRGLEGRFITAVYEDSHGFLWAATLIEGLYRFQYGRFTKVDVPGLTPGHSLHAVSEDERGNLWLGTNMGLFRCSGQEVRVYTSRDGLSDNRISAILQDSSGSVWVGTVNGLNRLQQTAPGVVTIEHCLPGLCINCLSEDREKSLWVGTNGSGLRQLKDGVFQTFSRDNGLTNFISALHEGSDGTVWIGTEYGQLYFARAGEITEFPVGEDILDLRIRTLGEDEAGNILVGTIRDGVFRVGKEKLEPYQRVGLDNLEGSIIQAIRRGTGSRTWIGTMGKGLYLVEGNPPHTVHYTVADGLASNVIIDVYEDKWNDTWIATSAGLNRLPKGRRQGFARYFDGIFILSVYRDTAGTVWLGTLGKGLTCFKPMENEEKPGTGDSPRFLGTAQGLGSNNVFQVLEDERQYLWMNSDAGILKVSGKEAGRFFTAPGTAVAAVECMIYGLSDGLTSIEGNAWGQNGALATKRGEFWFAMKKGVSVVTPAALTIEKLPPPQVIIEKVTVNGRIIMPGPGGVRKPFSFTDDDIIAFHFTAPTFIARERVKFRCRLQREGVAGNVQVRELAAGEPRMIVYEHLPEGRYRFFVTACGSDGTWNEKGVGLEFIIKRGLPVKTGLLVVIPVLLAVAVFVFRHWRRRLSIISGKSIAGDSIPGDRELAGSGGVVTEVDEETKKKYRTSALSPAQIEEYAGKLLYLLEYEGVYRDEKVSLTSLAGKLGIPPHQLSQVINEKLNKNFFDLINSYRIQEAKRRLLDADEEGRSILAIAYDVGFNTKAVFNRVFKKYTGMTPSQYRRKKISEDGAGGLNKSNL